MVVFGIVLVALRIRRLHFAESRFDVAQGSLGVLPFKNELPGFRQALRSRFPSRAPQVPQNQSSRKEAPDQQGDAF